MKIGKKIKDKKIEREEKKEIIAKIKQSKGREKEMSALRSVLFDHGL
jgi:hypothetical protein